MIFTEVMVTITNFESSITVVSVITYGLRTPDGLSSGSLTRGKSP